MRIVCGILYQERMSLLNAGEGAANYGVFPVTCVVDILWVSMTAYVQIWEPEKNTCYSTYRRLHTEQGIFQAGKKFTPLFPRLSMVRPTVTSSQCRRLLHFCNRPICTTLHGSLILRLSIASFDVCFTSLVPRLSPHAHV